MRVGLMASISAHGQATLESIVSTIVRAETAGLASVWTSGRFDALTQLALGGARTERIELGTAIVPTYPRHPYALAHQALTTQAGCAGRLVLGIGVSHAHAMSALGFDRSAPLGHAREYLTCLNGFLSGEALTFRGREFSVSEVTLPRAGAVGAPPVLLAALGPRMLRVAGKHADGTILWLSGAHYVRTVVVPRITAAARQSGRTPPRIVAGSPVCVTDDPTATFEQASRSLRGIGNRPVYRAILDLNRSTDPAEVALIGNEDRVADRLDELQEAGATDFAAQILTFTSRDYDRTFAFLAEYARRRSSTG